MPDYWIQIENHAWDVMPSNVDRMTGKTAAHTVSPPSVPVSKTLHSPVTNHSRTRTMCRPLAGDALILRRYTDNCAAPMDHKVNPWDVNERDPGEDGTMGTIPGPAIEANIGESVTVHFRNADTRDGFSDLQRCHSLHPHGSCSQGHGQRRRRRDRDRRDPQPHDPAQAGSGGDPDDIPIRSEDLPGADPAGSPVETHCVAGLRELPARPPRPPLGAAGIGGRQHRGDPEQARRSRRCRSSRTRVRSARQLVRVRDRRGEELHAGEAAGAKPARRLGTCTVRCSTT